MIPLHAENPVDALEWIDFYYPARDPGPDRRLGELRLAGPAAKPIVAGQLDDPAVANSPLVFPTEAELARLSEYPVTETMNSHDKWTALFDPIIQS